MINAALLRLIQDSGEGVLVLVDGLEEDELLRSRLTRGEVEKQLRTMAGALASLAPATRAAMPELDWEAWAATARGLAPQADPAQATDALWFAVRSLVPATLTWLRVYRQEQPTLFRFAA